MGVNLNLILEYNVEYGIVLKANTFLSSLGPS